MLNGTFMEAAGLLMSLDQMGWESKV